MEEKKEGMAVQNADEASAQRAQPKQTGTKYTRLINNTFLFAVSTLSSKLIGILLLRLYTGALGADGYGTADLLIDAANLLIPLVGLGIMNAVVRFGLEKENDKSAVYMGGLAAIFMGFTGMLLLFPLIRLLPGVRGNGVLLCVYVLVSCYKALNNQFVRARMLTRLYAFNGVLTSFFVLVFSLLFLLVFKWGPTGYLLSIICADLFSAIFLFFAGGIKNFISIKSFDKSLFKQMLTYSLPLVPAAISWWITNGSDKFFIAELVESEGRTANGIYGAAVKLPLMVSMVSTVFTEAWQLSAFTDGKSEDRDNFFSKIFSALMGVVFLMAGFLLLFLKPLTHILLPEAFFSARALIPTLMLATVFSCLSNFQNSVYMLEKRSRLSLLTMLAGAVANLALNAILIPRFALHGAAVATLASYVLVFVLRAFSTRRYIKVNYKPFKLLLNTVLCFGIGAIIILGQKTPYLWAAIILVVLILFNIRSFYGGVRDFIREKYDKKRQKNGF